MTFLLHIGNLTILDYYSLVKLMYQHKLGKKYNIKWIYKKHGFLYILRNWIWLQFLIEMIGWHIKWWLMWSFTCDFILEVHSTAHWAKINYSFQNSWLMKRPELQVLTLQISVIQVRMDQGLVVKIRCPMRSW